jgi:hypothetical protein
MAIAPEYFVLDGGVNPDGSTSLPRRPSTDDLGGDTKEDDDELPPDDVTMPTAAGHNQSAKVIAGLARVAAACKVEIDFTAGVPYVKGCSAFGSLVTKATFGTPADNGNGDTTLSWPADTFPPAEISPNGLTLYSNSTQVVAGHVELLTNGIRVRTFVNGVAANVPWSIHIN